MTSQTKIRNPFWRLKYTESEIYMCICLLVYLQKTRSWADADRKEYFRATQWAAVNWVSVRLLHAFGGVGLENIINKKTIKRLKQCIHKKWPPEHFQHTVI